MSANRLSWVVVAVVIIVVGLLVVRTVRHDSSTRIQSQATTDQPRATGQLSADDAATAAALAAADTFGMAGATGPRSTVERAKVVLRYRGYYSGPIDNNYDSAMADALRRFQADSGMKSTGYLDRKTYAKLGIVIGSQNKAKKLMRKAAADSAAQAGAAH